MAEQDHPYRVRTTTGTLRSKHPTMAAAEAVAKEANAEAMRLGIASRYEAHDEQ